MEMKEAEYKGFTTKALHCGWNYDPTTGSFALPIYATAAYKLPSVDEAAALFSLEKSGHTYSRISNPTVAAFEEKIAALEGGAAAVATSSGQAAFAHLVMLLCKEGDHIVAERSSYGGTITLLKNLFSKFGVTTSFVDINDVNEVERNIKPRTRCIIAETIGNPGLNIPPLEELGEVAEGHGIPLVVDNTFASPALCRPLEWGAHIVVHSTTKYIDGFGNAIGGVVVDGGNFRWAELGEWPEFTEPDPAYHGVVFCEKFGRTALAAKLRACILRDLGGCLSPHNAHLLCLGLATLSLRMERHSKNAMDVAQFLESHGGVEWVLYPGLSSHPQHDLAKAFLRGGHGGMVAFCIKGGLESGKRFLDGLKLFSIVPNLGDARSMAIHPATTTHSQLSAKELKESGIDEGLIRLSIGLEDIEDIIEDLRRGLEAAQ